MKHIAVSPEDISDINWRAWTTTLRRNQVRAKEALLSIPDQDLANLPPKVKAAIMTASMYLEQL